MSKSGIIILSTIVLCSAFSNIQDTSELQFPSYFPAPKYNFNDNPLDSNKIQLGRAFFYDPILSADSTISCASCHSPYSAFTHGDHALSHGIHDSIGRRNSPALMNLAWSMELMWDGAINHLEMQPLAPLHSKAEMGEDIKNVLKKINRSPRYRALIQDAYQDTIIHSEQFLKAIAQFELTLISANSKYDKVMSAEADVSFTQQELNGYELFQLHCNACHTEPLFTNFSFENIGLTMDPELNDLGRIEITQDSNDINKFKVPTLRNIEFSAPYMHDGRFKKLSEVIMHYNSGIEHSEGLAQELREEMNLSSNDQVDLLAFMLTLSDREFIFNPDYGFPREFFSKTSDTH